MKKTMSCSDLAERLELVLGEQLRDNELTALKAHVEGCEKCRDLLQACRGKQTLEQADSLVGEVLARTSGSTCSRVRSMLCDHVDQSLHEDNAALVQEHLNYCSSCTQLARVLEESAVALPQMASLDPGPLFTSSVLAATRSSQPPDKWALFLSHLSLVFQRPHFSLEAAYVGALLVFLVFGGAPVSAVGGVASAAFAGFQLNFAKVVRDTPAGLSDTWTDLYGSCENQLEGKIKATQGAVGRALETLQGSAEQLRAMSDEHLLKHAAALFQDATEKYEEYSRNLGSTEGSEDRPEETAE